MFNFRLPDERTGGIVTTIGGAQRAVVAAGRAGIGGVPPAPGRGGRLTQAALGQMYRGFRGFERGNLMRRG